MARRLLGTRLVRILDGARLSGIISETEAYMGGDDSASHAFRGRTPRNQVMFGPPGYAYVYFVYGMHNMLNVVTGEEDIPWAVLIRAIEPQEGIDTIRTRRNGRNGLCNGPGKLCQALGIDRQLNGWDLTRGQRLWIEAGHDVAEADIRTSPRVGIDYALPEHRNLHWRFEYVPEQSKRR